MVSLSKRNKRTSLHQKYKVAKKVKQHHKDVKKTLKNKKPKKPLPLSMQIPMECPFKEKIIKEIDENALKEKEKAKKQAMAKRFLKKAEPVNEFEELKAKLMKDSSRAFIGDIRKLIADSDIICLVLDARDPMGTRSLETENLIKTAGKTMIFILNKIDLVPIENMKAWMAYLSKEARTFPFKANCQEQAQNLGIASGAQPSRDLNGSSASYGVDNLLNHLRPMNKGSIKSKSTKSANKLIIGIAGVPNTGKSSVINSIKRKRICEAGNVAGLTRNLQHVALDNHIELVDSPGIVLARSNDPAEFALRNCVRVEKIEDPVAVAEAIFNRCQRIQLQHLYKLPEFDNVTEFMCSFASRMCPLKKGGVPNLKLASVKLINDWNKGKISYCTEPPAMGDSYDFQLDEDDISKFIYRPTDGANSIAVLPKSSCPRTVVDDQMTVEEGNDGEESEKESVDMDE